MSLKLRAVMSDRRVDRYVKLSVEETCPHPASAQCRTGEDEDVASHDPIHITRCRFLDRCVGIWVSGLQRCLRAARRVLSCCYCNESVEPNAECNVMLPEQESTPSQISIQPRGQNDEVIRAMLLQPTHAFLRTIPVYPWADTQAD